MAPKPSKKLQVTLYLRLRMQDISAPVDFAIAFLQPLLDALHAAFPADGSFDSDLVDECVLDTLLHFPQQPEKYRPEKGSLWTYLYIDAKGNLLNALEREARKDRHREAALPSVALEAQSRNEQQEDELWKLPTEEPPVLLPAGVDFDLLQREVEVILSNDTDLAIVELMVAGTRETERFSSVLGISDLPLKAQRQEVKRVKDKWKKRLIRLGAKLNET
jgi:hypothetical protein